VVYDFDIKAAIGAVLINAVQKNFPGNRLLTGLCKLQGINAPAFSSAFDGAMIPKDLGTENEKLFFSNKLLGFPQCVLYFI